MAKKSRINKKDMSLIILGAIIGSIIGYLLNPVVDDLAIGLGSTKAPEINTEVEEVKIIEKNTPLKDYQLREDSNNITWKEDYRFYHIQISNSIKSKRDAQNVYWWLFLGGPVFKVEQNSIDESLCDVIYPRDISLFYENEEIKTNIVEDQNFGNPLNMEGKNYLLVKCPVIPPGQANSFKVFLNDKSCHPYCESRNTTLLTYYWDSYYGHRTEYISSPI